ncbi:MAG: carbon-nitrogen hydrolase family protein [Phycisphaerae bacterium]|nr:carbon-nitrogen hydrolase family protein [Phycisphaerae bacterium]
MTRSFRLAVSSIDKQNCVEHCVGAIVEAGTRGADLVVLPEEPDIVSGAEPGVHALDKHPVFEAFRSAGIKAKIAVVASLSAKVQGGYANTGFLLSGKGKLVGVYRKKHPAPSEEAIVTAPASGDPFPVFELDGVRLGIGMCMDIHFPEMFRIYGLKGADLVCLPTMYLDYTGDMLESIEKARAIDSQMYFALSRYIDRPFLAGKNMGYAKVIAPDGRVIASTGHKDGVAIAEFDPKWRMPFWATEEPLKSMYPDLRVMFDRIRRPDLYGELVKPKQR